MISSEPLKINALVGWLSDLALLKNQCDGWGISAYQRSNLILYFRESTPIWERPTLHFPKADIAIVHARKASEGSISFLNSHPFARLYRGRFWSFCHNGSLKKELLKVKRGELSLLGETDSELLFLYILEGIEGSNLNKPEETLSALSEVAGELKDKREELRLSAVNFLLTDGSSLFAFRGARLREEWFTLWVRDFEERLLRRDVRGSIISSEPIPEKTDEWTSIPNWTLVGRWFGQNALMREETRV